jgi:hypothetical protein
MSMKRRSATAIPMATIVRRTITKRTIFRSIIIERIIIGNKERKG